MSKPEMNLDVDAPDKVAAVLTAAASAYQASAAELSEAWQDTRTPMIRAWIAGFLDTAAQDIERAVATHFGDRPEETGAEEEVSEDLEARISMLIKHSKGTMPVGLLASSKEEAAKAVRIIATKRGGKIVRVYIRQDGYDIQFKPDSPAQPE